jgi:AraC family transcriptional regulator
MRYVRDRRLAEAAKALVVTRATILQIALEAGYQSHEAFTRAFIDAYRVSPSELRRSGRLQDLLLQEAVVMTKSLTPPPADIRTAPALRLAGLAQDYKPEEFAAIPALWQRFIPYLDDLLGPDGGVTYGICYGDAEPGLTYMAAVGVAPGAQVEAPLTTLDVPAGRYAIYRHEGHISAIRSTWTAIFEHWPPVPGLVQRRAPELEVYSADFDPQAGTGYVEIWIPVEE